MKAPLIKLISPELKYTGVTLYNPKMAVIPHGVTAIIGANGSGKSSLARVLESGWNFMTNHIESTTGTKLRVRSMTFADLHTLTGMSTEYYQQRFESMMSDSVPTLRELMGDKLGDKEVLEMFERLDITKNLDKRTNYLSSGELRRFLIANILTDSPDVLILDNPYIGLDVKGRDVLNEALPIISSRGTSIVLLLSDTDDIPESADAVIAVNNLVIGPTTYRNRDESIEVFRRQFEYLFDFSLDTTALNQLKLKSHQDGTPLVDMEHCRVSFGDIPILDDVTWSIKGGENWSLTGPNGSGKSTLLSLINADNPQAYSNDIKLFGLKRGSGESIWDIKKRIGFVSSELHLYFKDMGATVSKIIGRSLKDSPTDFSPLSDEQTIIVDAWLKLFRIYNLRDNLYRNLSFGQQRLVLLIAAMAKDPDLLILDEPLHGMDKGHKRALKWLFERLTSTSMSLIYVTHCPDEIPSTVTHHKTLWKKS